MMKYRIPLVLLLILCRASAGYSLDSLGVRRVNALYDFNLYSADVSIEGDYGYVAGGESGIWVIDLQDIEGYHPPIFRSERPMNVLDVLAVDELLYVGDALFGLRIFDISNPREPEEVGNLRIFGQPCDLFIDGTILYIAAGDHGMRRVDVSDWRNPRETGFFNHQSSTSGVYISGRYAYLADYNRGLRVIDLADQQGFRQIFNLGNYPAKDILSWNNQVIVVTANWFDAFDPTQPDNPRIIGRFPQGSYINFEDATLVGSNFIGIDHWGLLYLVDLNGAPNYSADTINICLRSIGIDADREIILLASGESGIKSYHYENLTYPTFAGGFGDRGHTYEMKIEDNILYLALGEGGLEIFDIENPLQPERLSVTPLSNEAVGVWVNGDYAFVTLRLGGLVVLDISDRQNPTIISREEDFGRISDMVFKDSIAVMACWASEEMGAGIYTLDVRDPENLPVLGSIPVENFRGIYFAVSDDRVFFVASNEWFYHLDVSDPTNPVHNWFVPSPGLYCHGYDVVVKGDYAYASYENIGLAVIDVSDPQNMVRVAMLDYRWPSFPFRLQIVDSLLYMEDYGVRVFSLADPERPLEKGHYVGMNTITGMAAKDNYVFLSTLKSLVTLDCSRALDVEQNKSEEFLPTEISLTISPNPFNSATSISVSLPRKADVSLALYDLTGKHVTIIASGTKNPGNHGSTLDGSSLPAGVYMVVLRTESETVIQKVVNLR